MAPQVPGTRADVSGMRLALLLIVLTSLGCATASPVTSDLPPEVPYQPLAISVPSRAPQLLEASQRALTRDGFIVTRAGDGELEAIRDPQDGSRDRAHVQVEDGLLKIDLRSELLGDDGTWLRADKVCGSYRHVREWELAGQIRHEMELAIR